MLDLTYEMVRPDNIIRSGIIEPFSVRSSDPVQYARNEVVPFIQAIRPQGATMNGGLGLVSPEVIRTLGADANTAAQPTSIITKSEAVSKFVFGVGGFTGGLIVGALAMWLLKR